MRRLLLTRAVAVFILGLIIVAALLAQWISLPARLMLPYALATVLFSLGYVVMVARLGHLTRGTRISAVAVMVFVAANVVSAFSSVAAAFYVAAILLALFATCVLLREAQAAAG